MTRMASFASVVVFAVTSCAAAGPTAASAATAPVRITNSHLVATCLDGKTVTAGTRNWNLGAPASLTVTMRNEPRSGVANVPPGVAVITFTPEEGHRYEIEVRASATANSQRVWAQGEWTPVVRDRTTDKVVSSEPSWLSGNPCPSA